MNNKTLVTWGITLLVLFSFSYANEITGMFITGTPEETYNITAMFMTGSAKITSTVYSDDLKSGTGNYTLDIAIGQNMIVDPISNINNPTLTSYVGYIGGAKGKYDLCLGTLCLYIEPRYDINITGSLSYLDQNNIEKDSKVTAVVYLKNDIIGEYYTTVNEDSTFDIELSDIPESIIDEAFTVELYVEGRVEAVYWCEHRIENEIHYCDQD